MNHDYFASAQLYRARFAKFHFRFSQPPIDDSWTKNLIYLDKKDNFFMTPNMRYKATPESLGKIGSAISEEKGPGHRQT